MSIIGNRYECQYCGRIARIIDEYDDGPGDTGYIYEFESEPNHSNWISTNSAAMRFRKIGDDAKSVKEKLQASLQQEK